MKLRGAAIAIALVALACSPATTQAPSPAGVPATSAPAPSLAPPPPSASGPIPSGGFAFDAESVVGYYRTLGYACGEPQPSAQADGYLFTTCRFVDAAGRTLVVGVVTDARDELADGFASVRGAAGETVLEPSVALQPLAAFLGAMLGEQRGESMLTWLAGHLGDAYAETTIDDLHVATYTATPTDHSTLYVEIANQAYLDAPKPSGSPGAS